MTTTAFPIIVKGDHVRVTRGIKVPVGTEGSVFWIGETKFGQRVGFTTAEGTKHFTALGNVSVPVEAEAVEELFADCDTPVGSGVETEQAVEVAPEVPAPEVEIPASKYALVGADGVLRFYQVDAPKTGKWAGYRFVKALVGCPGDWRRVRVSAGERLAVEGLILSDEFADLVGIGTDADEASGTIVYGPAAGVLRYAREFTRCGVCDAPLSDPASLARGIGPICAGRF